MKYKNYLKSARPLICLVIIMVINTFNTRAQIVSTITASGSFTVPSGVTSLKIEAWGTGGSGGGATGTGLLGLTISGGGGGGGGAYNVSTLAVSGGQVYSITIGAIGSTGTGNGGAGGATTVTGPAGSVTANGGAGGGANNGSGGAGGVGNRNGGAGGAGAGANGAGGGGGAGNNGNGTAGTNTSAGTGGVGNPNVAPYIGGNGAASQGSNGNNGNGGIVPGGGGGGGRGYTLDNASGGAGARGQVVLTYTFPPPVITSLGSTGSCAGGTITINGSNFTGATAANVTIGGTPVTAILSNTGSQIVATIGNGTTGLVSVTTAGGTGTSASPFNVYNLPSAPSVTPPSATVDAGLTTTFDASGTGVSFAWYSAATGGTLLANTSTYSPPPSCANATFYAEQTSSDGCTGTRTAATLTRTPTPAPSITPPSATVTAGLTTSFVASGTGTSFAWYSAATGGTLLANTSTYSPPASCVNATFYAEQTANGCTGSRIAATLIRTPIPAPSVTPPSATVIAGLTTSFDASGTGTSFAWYSAATGGTLLANTATYTPPASCANATFYAEQTANGCTGSRTAATLTRTPIPAPSVTPPSATVIAGLTTSFDASGTGTSFAWYSAATGGTLLANTATYTPPASCANATFYAEQTANGCTGSRTAATLTRTPIPAPSVTPPSATVIAGMSTTFTASGTGSSFAWYSASTGGTLLANTATFNTPGSCANATYYAEQTENGCASSRTATNVTATPLAAPATTDGSICGLGLVNVSGTPALGGNTCNWYAAATGGTALLTNATSANVPVNASGSFTYYASTKNSTTGCESPTRTAVTATSLPQLIATPVVSPATVCPGSNVSLSSGVSRSGKSNVNVSIPLALFSTTNANSPLTVSGFSSALNNTSVKINYVKVNITHSSVAALKVRLVAPDASVFNLTNQTGSGANFTNTVFQAGGAALTSGTAPYTGTFAPQQAFSNFNGKNPNGIWTLNVQNVGTIISPAGNIEDWEINFIDGNGITYSWTSSPAGFTSSSSNPSVTPAQNTLYNLTINGPGGCSVNASVSAAVSPLPVVQAFSNAPICNGSNLSLFGNNTGSGQVTGNTYSWSGPNGYSSGAQNPSVGNGSSANAGTYTLTITNQFGCSSSSTTLVAVNPNPVLSVASVTNASCPGTSDGCVDVNASGGTPLYVFNLDGNASLDGIFCGLQAGSYTASVIDDNGCEAQQLAVSVTDLDLIPPVITTSATDRIAQCDGAGNAADFNDWLITNRGDADASDNCSGVTYLDAHWFNNYSAANWVADCGTTKHVNVGFYVIDESGNNSVLTYGTFYIIDTLPPVITFTPPAINANTDVGLCTSTAAIGTAVASDDCAGAGMILTNDAPVLFPVGNTLVTWTATDQCGNSSISTQTITVADNENPVPNCASAQTQTNDVGDCGADMVVSAPAPADNCGVLSVVNDYNSTADASDHYNIGTTTVTWTVTDIHGNTSTCAQNITITDNENPVIICPADVILNNTPGLCESTAIWTAPAGTDNCPGALTELTGELASGSSFPVGTTTITYTATDASNNTAACSFNVVVVDNETPVITCPANVSVNNTPGICEGIATWTALAGTDNCSGAITTLTGGFASGSSFPVGTTPITYTVTDAANHNATCSFNVVVVDNESPVIICPANVSVNNTPGLCEGIATWTAPAGTDNCSGSLTSLTGGFASGTSFPVGTTPITYTVTDAANQSATCSFNVVVVDNENPVITCPPNVTVNNTPGLCESIATWTEPLGTDNCSGVLTGLTGGFANGSSFPVGTTPITYTVTDAANNSVTCSFNVVVVDNENPLITCPANVTVNNTPGLCESVATWAAPLGTDNCSGAFISLTGGFASGSSFPVGTTPITYTVTDAANHSATCSFNVVVVDNENPVITCPANVTVNNTPGLCAGIATWTSPIGNDNCPGSVTTLTGGYISGSSFPVGITPITYTVTDAFLNTATCSFNVVVVDNQAPNITCPPDVIANNNPGFCYATPASLGIPTTGDNCGLLSITNNAPAQFPVGATIVDWEVEDLSGNKTQCQQFVIVQDNENPTISGMPSNITFTANPANCNPSITWTAPTAADNCSVASFTSTANPGDNFSEGTTTVIYTAVDINGNQTQASFIVTILTQPLAINITSPVFTCGYNISCNGNNNGQATATVGGGCLPYSLQWSNGSTTNSNSSLTAGTYTLTVTDGNGHVTVQSVTLTQPPALVTTLGPDQSYEFSCTCANLAAVTSGGATCSPYSYEWSTGTTSSSLTVCPNQTTTYTVTVTDANGCVTSDAIQVIKPAVVGQLDRYVIMGTGTGNVSIGNGCSFTNGSVGKRLAAGTLSLGNNTFCNISVAGNNVTVGNNAIISTLYRNTATIGSGALISSTVSPVTMPLTAKVPCFPVFSGGANVNVPNNTTMTISPGTYNNVTLGNNSILKLNAGVYNVNSISTFNGSFILPNGAATAKDIMVFVKTSMNVSNNNEIHGSYYAQGAMNLANGNNTTGSFFGAYFGNPVSVGNNLSFFLDSYCYSNLALCTVKMDGDETSIEAEVGTFNLFPNPNSGMFTIQYAGETGNDVKLTVLNTLGQVVYERKVYEFAGEIIQDMDLSNLNPGVYFMQIVNGNEQSNKQFIITK